MAFSVSATHQVTSLGRWVVSGNSASHAVSLYLSTGGGAGTLLGSVTVATSGATAGQFAYVALGTPVTLSAGNTYFLMSLESNGGDQWYDDDTTYTLTSGDFAAGGSEYKAPPYTQHFSGAHTYGPVRACFSYKNIMKLTN